jgi:site-specific DNA recombinase
LLLPDISPYKVTQPGQIRDKSDATFSQRNSGLSQYGLWLIPFFVAMTLSRRRITNAKPIPPEDILPPCAKKRNKPPEDRGLPGDEVLGELAREYLVWQKHHWPELFASGLLAEPTEVPIAAMVENFKARHRYAVIDRFAWEPYLEAGLTLFGNYNRYSSDNSQATSIVDQLVKALGAAAAKKHFIPWEFVFGDYAISGLDASRLGYKSYKSFLTNPSVPIRGTYIDDFTRASRCELEWWRLAKLSRVLKKSMFGASDGFDLNHESWDIQLTIFGLVSRLYIKSARQKTRRGMEGAARRFKTHGRLDFGFTKYLQRDAKGEIIRDSEGEPVYGIAQFPEYVAIRREICEMFGLQSLSTYRLEKVLNLRKAAGWDRWCNSVIRRILYSPANIGVFIFNRYRNEPVLDENGDEKLNKNGKPRMIRVQTPKSDWIVVYAPHLAVISLDLWRVIRRRLAKNRRPSNDGVQSASRNEVCATTLFSGTLYCEACKRELTLSRGSAHGDGCMHCANGKGHLSGCTLTTHKSVRIIEKSLLDYLLNHVLTEAAVSNLVEKGNTWVERLKTEAPDAAKPIKDEIRRLQHKIKRNLQLAEEESEDKEGNELTAADFRKRARELRKQVTEKTKQLREIEPVDPATVTPLDRTRLLGYLADARTVFKQEVPIAAAAIRALTGRIEVRQVKDPGRKRGATWIAVFQPNLLNLLRHATKDRDIPEAIALGALSRSIWNELETVEVPLEFQPRYELVAEKVQTLRKNGASGFSIQRALGLSFQQYKDALLFAETGKRPPPAKPKRTYPNRGGKKTYRYREIAAEVVRLRHEAGLTMPAIGKKLGISKDTAMKAYDYAHADTVRSSAEAGKPLDRRPKLKVELESKILKFLAAGESLKRIAAKLKCSETLIANLRRRMAAGEA